MSALPQSRHHGFRILIVDDDRSNRLILSAILHAEGYAIVEAENGEVATRVFAETQPDVVLMDVVMPVMDGYAACTAIKSLAGERFVPVIFLTGLQDDDALVRCVAAGGDDFLSKPYNRTLLKAKIESLGRVAMLYSTLSEQHQQLTWHQGRQQADYLIAEQVMENTIHSDHLERSHFKYMRAPSTTFNGDLILLAPTPSGGLHVMLGDFTGHGLSAAIGAIPASETFYGMTAKGFGIVDIAKELNHKLCRILPTNLFLAAGFLHLDANGITAQILNAGIPDMLMLHGDGELQRFASQTMPLGIAKNAMHDLGRGETFSVPHGSRFILYSDGVIEAQAPDEQMFGQTRLEACLQAARIPEQAFDLLLQDLVAFRQGYPQTDDMTAIEIICDPKRLSTLQVPGQQNPPGAKRKTHWSLQFRFQADSLQETDPLPLILQNLTELQGFDGHRESLYTILAELFSNALEHGVLDMDSSLKSGPSGYTQYYTERAARLSALSDGYIGLDIEHLPAGDAGKLVIRTRWSGTRLDPETLDHPPVAFGPSGRGLLLLASLCESIRCLEDGYAVEAVYLWT